MVKKKDKKVEDIEFEILAAEAHLEVLKKKKAKLNKNNFITTHFNQLPNSIKNAAAHIAIRNNESVVVLFCYVVDRFIIYDKFSIVDETVFTESGKHTSTNFDVEPICKFALNFHESTIDYFNYFGGVIIPKTGNEYAIEPLKINSDFQIDDEKN